MPGVDRLGQTVQAQLGTDLLPRALVVQAARTELVVLRATPGMLSADPPARPPEVVTLLEQLPSWNNSLPG